MTEIDESGCLVELTNQEVQPDVAKDVEKWHRNVITDSVKDDGMQSSSTLVSSESCCNAEKTANAEKNISLQPTNKYLYQVAEYIHFPI